MIRFIRTVLAIASLNSTLAWAYLQINQPENPIPPWQTSSVLLTMPHGQRTDIILLGTSHARSMTGCPASTEALGTILNADVVNLAKNTGGPYPMGLFLNEFYARGNSADVLIYFADPYVFYTRKWNEEHGFLLDEPLEPRFFLSCLTAGSSPRQLFKNARQGFSKRRFDRYLAESNDCFVKLDRTNPQFIRHRVEHLYGGTPNAAVLDRYAARFARICKMAKRNGTRIIIATPPTLLGELAGMDAFMNTMETIAAEYGAHYFNFADSMLDPAYFQDHDHLNAVGVAHFTEHYLVPAIAQSRS